VNIILFIMVGISINQVIGYKIGVGSGVKKINEKIAFFHSRLTFFK
jgi:hypothetical protein